VKAGLVGLIVAGIGVLAGLAAAGADTGARREATTDSLCPSRVIGLSVPRMLIGRGGSAAPDARRARAPHS
jgi:hypothetical protein